MKNNENKAKPCPFCGSVRLVESVAVSPVVISCYDCGAEGPAVSDGENDISAAIAAWNKRNYTGQPVPIYELKYYHNDDSDVWYSMSEPTELKVSDKLKALLDDKSKMENLKTGHFTIDVCDIFGENSKKK